MEWLNYHHLLYFWTAVRAGGITRAAEELRLSPPTISAQLRELEDFLGEKLLVRSGRNLVPTEMGHVIFRYAEEIFGLGREMVDMVRGRPTGRPARLIIGIADVLPKLVAHNLILPALQVGEPVRIVCREDNLEHLAAALAVQELDVVLADAPLSPSVKVRAYNHLLGETGVSFLATRKLAAAYRRKFPGSLNGAPLLLPTDNSAIRRNLDLWFQTREISPQIMGEFEDDALLREFGERGAGIFPAHSVIESQMRRRYGLHLVGRTNEVRGRFFAISTERRVKHPAVAAICATARRTFG